MFGFSSDFLIVVVICSVGLYVFIKLRDFNSKVNEQIATTIDGRQKFRSGDFITYKMGDKILTAEITGNYFPNILVDPLNQDYSPQLVNVKDIISITHFDPKGIYKAISKMEKL